jgi:hypothetical protein
MRLALCLASMILMGCPPSEQQNKTPAGTPTDPVEVCERAVDVCRYKGSQLGVCTQNDDGLICMPQH